jgi:hypothetical protein
MKGTGASLTAPCFRGPRATPDELAPGYHVVPSSGRMVTLRRHQMKPRFQEGTEQAVNLALLAIERLTYFRGGPVSRTTNLEG